MWLNKGCGVVGGGINTTDRFGRNDGEGTSVDVINVVKVLGRGVNERRTKDCPIVTLCSFGMKDMFVT